MDMMSNKPQFRETMEFVYNIENSSWTLNLDIEITAPTNHTLKLISVFCFFRYLN